MKPFTFPSKYNLNNITVKLKGLSSEIYLAESGITRRSLLKGEAPRSSEDFAHPLSRKRLFKCWRHLIQDLGYDKLISNNSTNLW
jgi:hypothetical protein